ncbi:small membrane A-kinase anchor protein [Sorex araneus]|uniref:small membrane A-kinase anchor protein n=1 Tax=Sorex araneus TaxID=42254 RepID=UPI00033193C1|nr:small membrane A-kinase anchor protein [Sorex araneus]
MGCMKSKQTFPFPNTFDNGKQNASKESCIPDDRFLPRKPSSSSFKEDVKEPPVASVAITNFADHLSQKILSDAMQQWASNNIKYQDIPYIESDGQ